MGANFIASGQVPRMNNIFSSFDKKHIITEIYDDYSIFKIIKIFIIVFVIHNFKLKFFMKHGAIYTILLLSIVLSQNLSNTQIEKLKEFESEMKSQVQTKSTSNNENQISLNEINIDTQNENTLSSSFLDIIILIGI